MQNNNTYRSWDEFTKSEYRRVATFQLSIEELAADLYFDEKPHKVEEEEEELNFDL